MKFLYELFEEELSSEASLYIADGSICIRGEKFSPVEILKLSRPSDDEKFSIDKRIFQEWLDEYIEGKVEAADEILSEYEQEDLFALLTEAHKKSSVIPFIGAGMSIPSGYPGWDLFLRNERKKTAVTEDDLNSIISQGDYEQAAQVISDFLGHGFGMSVNAAFGRDRKICGPVRFLPHIFQSHVITTNFDAVLERVYREHGISFDGTRIGSDCADISKSIIAGEKIILKLHGKASAGRGRILTKNEYNSHYTNGNTIKKTIGLFCTRYNLLFLGCSLTFDRTLQCLEEHVNDHGHDNLPCHYAFLADPGDPTSRINRQQDLVKYHIYPIWFPPDTHADSIEALLLKLNSKI